MSEDTRDEAWLDARERGEPIEHIDGATRTRYENLQRHIAALPDDELPEGWQDRVIARLDRGAPAVRRRFKTLLLAGAAVAAVVAIVITIPPGAGEPFAFAVERGGRVYRGDSDWLVHDLLRVRAASRFAAFRIYTAHGRVLAACPGGPGCNGDEIVVELPTPDTLAIVGFTGCTPPHASDDRAADEVAATSAGCTLVHDKPHHVR